MIEFKLAMRTEDGTRMFRAVMDGQVCIRPEWMFDPFREAVPCFKDSKEMDECASRLFQRAIRHGCVAEDAYFEILAIATAIETLDKRRPDAPFYADVSVAEALQYEGFAGLRACAEDAGNSLHVQRRANKVLSLLFRKA